ncbi:MAG: NAD(P)/FAD-dependent oxidoreductase [bacterium]|nr:NAD(P)/FAD-dependent oxidoreductase [bacterium]
MSHSCIVGGGITGLAAAWDLTQAGFSVTVLEREDSLGGLAASFDAGGYALERFYHHWFTSDTHIIGLIEELGLGERLVSRESRTGMYYANTLFRLSNPLDLLRFTPLPFVDRLRLGLLVPVARSVRDWRRLEGVTARDWLVRTCGENVYRVVWEPLLRGKFGDVADEISAVWLWNKLCLRGGSRAKSGAEVLLYFDGGFGALVDGIRDALVARGVEIRTGDGARALEVRDGAAVAVLAESGRIPCDNVLVTTPLPIAADLLGDHLDEAEAARLRRIRYLANICLVLELRESLSELYWINVNDPSFPFVGVIEHTNFEPVGSYGGRHIVYLSRYLPQNDATYHLSDEEYLAYALGFLRRMFPAFRDDAIIASHVWRADYAQPIVERDYSALVPPMHTSLRNVVVSSMAQIYPEDRGTNYAVRGGREAAALVAELP